MFKKDWPILLVGGATLANGLLGIVQVLLVRFLDSPRLFAIPLPFGLYHTSRSLTLVFGFMLVYLSINLLQRKRVAWWLTIGVLMLSVLAHFGRGQLWYAAMAPAATIVILFLFRRRFTVRSEPRSVVHGLAFMVFSILVALAYGTVGFWLLEQRDFGLTFNIADATVRALREFTLIGNSDLVPRTPHAYWFLESLRLLGLVAGIFAAYSLFRPISYRLRTLPQEREFAKAILTKHGRSALDYFKLWSDKSYFFSSTRRSFIAYRTAVNVAIVLGDPVGPEDDLESTTLSFVSFCTDNGWGVAFYSVLPDLLPMYHRLGFKMLKIGEDATVDLEKLSSHKLNTGEFGRIRRKFESEGYKLVRYNPPHSAHFLDEVEEVSNEWLSLPGRRERGFTLGHFERSYLNRTPLFVLRDPSGQLIAFVNEIPSYRSGEATIDLMRHRLDISHGAMDYLLLGLMVQLKVDGYRLFNLGLAPFSGVGDQPGATMKERAVHQLFENLNRFFSYKGLRNYKAKFDPVWEDRFLVYRGGSLRLAKTALAISLATEG